MKEALYDILDPEFDEVSVVDKGDNPGARIVLWKGAPEEELLTDEEIEKCIIDVANEPEEVAKLTSASSAAGQIQARAAEIRRANPHLDEAAALSKAMDENPALMARYRELRDLPADDSPVDPYERAVEAQRASVRKLEATPAFRDLLTEVAEIRKERPDLPEGQVWAEAERRKPDVYAKARRETMS